MPAAALKKSAPASKRRSLPVTHDLSVGRPIAALLKARIKREQKLGLVLTVPDGKVRMTVPAAAARYQYSEWTIRWWINEGWLPYVRVGRQLRFTEEDFLACANRSTVGA
jgi:excisionase family DNA binding protein